VQQKPVKHTHYGKWNTDKTDMPDIHGKVIRVKSVSSV